mmetsp:Transcript_46123/g.147595  ORF Transcript_46123/g.147595 Transcript_46123/m.147595 type:complete len:144 (+) Transcript_46123:30-461(+)
MDLVPEGPSLARALVPPPVSSAWRPHVAVSPRPQSTDTHVLYVRICLPEQGNGREVKVGAAVDEPPKHEVDPEQYRKGARHITRGALEGSTPMRVTQGGGAERRDLPEPVRPKINPVAAAVARKSGAAGSGEVDEVWVDNPTV